MTLPVSGLAMLDLHPIRIPSMRDPICISAPSRSSDAGGVKNAPQPESVSGDELYMMSQCLTLIHLLKL